VGREAELALLRELVDGARAADGRVLFLSGESGMGKTRLAQTLVELAQASRCRALLAQAWPAEGTFPFALAAEALSQLVRELGSHTVTLLSRGHESDLALILPTLARAGAVPEPPTGGDAKARLFWQVERFVRRAAEQMPIVLVLENLQWADASSLELLHFLARQMAGAHMATLCTYNSFERDLAPGLRATERSLVRAGRAATHELRPLGRDDVAALLRHARGGASGGTDALADLLYRRTLGNPFFVGELLTAASHVEGPAASWSDAGGRLPDSVREAVLARADAVSAAARSVLDCVAAMSLRGPQAVVADVTALAPDDLGRATAELVARGLLAEHADGAGVWYDCQHPIVRATVYDHLGRTRAQALHARIADAFERLPAGSEATGHVNEVAWHYARAGDAAPVHKAARFLALAGRDALARRADHEAATLLQGALAHAAGGDAGDGLPRASLLDDLARARQRLGEYGAAYALWGEARHLAKLPGDAEFVARIEHRMGLCAFWDGRPLDAVKHYDAAIATARAHGLMAATVRTLNARSTALRAVGDVEGARADVGQALERAQATGDPALLARAHRAMLLAHAWTGPAHTARDHATKALEFAERSGDGAVAWSAHWAMALLAGFTGDGATVARHSAEAERWARQLDSPVLLAWTSEILVEYASAAGEWTNAVAAADRAINVARAAAAQTLLPRLLVWKGLVLVARDDLDGARTCFDEAWSRAGADAPDAPGADVHAVIPAHTGRTAYQLALRDFEGAIRVGERGLAIADRHGYVAWAIHRLLPFVCEAAILAGDHERAARYAVRLRRDAALLDHRLARTWADAADALLRWRRDGQAEAAQALRAAAADLEGVPFLFHAARLRRNAADVLAQTGDRDGALAELRLAHEMFRRMGAERDLRGTREEIRALGARPPQRATPGSGTLTGREREIVRLLADRRTNREIGEALDISPRTVSTHLANVFQKLGIDSRGALIDLAREDPSLLCDSAS
jgi:DNA-binding CsgD family transcriptional regulator/tetratricopeptide (TPR) repeat protein